MSEHSDIFTSNSTESNISNIIINNIEITRCEDSIVKSVVSSFLERSRIGQIKYGTNLDRTDLSTMQWIQHAQEELMDGILYLEKLKHTLSLEKK
jgi:hypothetical protein